MRGVEFDLGYVSFKIPEARMTASVLKRKIQTHKLLKGRCLLLLLLFLLLYGLFIFLVVVLIFWFRVGGWVVVVFIIMTKHVRIFGVNSFSMRQLNNNR